jgi:serine/threonine-protein kinase RsbW
MGNQPDQQASSVDTLLDSALQSVEEAESLVLKVARAANFPEEELYRLNMAVRETVVNAVVHGNRYSAHKKIHFQVSGSKDRITVTVGDEGNGFDLASLPDPLAEENLLHQSGRGLLLVRAFVDEFQVRRLTPRGTQVELVKRLTHES